MFRNTIFCQGMILMQSVYIQQLIQLHLIILPNSHYQIPYLQLAFEV